MSSLKFTIYEILGYIAPGIVGCGALALVVWTAFLPNHTLPIAPYSLSKEAIGLLVFAAYAIGHLVQGLCNFHPSPEKMSKKNNQHGTLLTGARAGLVLQCGYPIDEYDIEDVVVLAQTSLLNTGGTDDFDVYLYEKDFIEVAAVHICCWPELSFFVPSTDIRP